MLIKVSGDSYTSTGFNYTGIQPSDGNPLGNPPYHGWTSANGPNWVDFLTVQYNDSLLYTYNLAVGGATIDSALVAPYLPTVYSLAEQIQNWFFPGYASGPSAPVWSSSDTLFGVWIGINDVGNSWWKGLDASTALNKAIFAVYRGLMEMMYQSGARNFLFLTVPPVDRAPLTLAQSPENQAAEKADILAFNSAINALAKNLKAVHSDVNIFTLDTYDLFTKVLDNPSSFPQTALYKNTTAYCTSYQK
jgi:phospholipase/lecithinase/hemolysin